MLRNAKIAVAIASGAMVLVSSGTAHAIDLAPHQVTYMLQLKDADPATTIEQITGKTIFSIRRECEGWKSGEDYVMQMLFEDGNEFLMASLFDSFEDSTGALFSFTIDEKSNYEKALRFDGFAQQTSDDNSAKEAFFSIEPDTAMSLPEDTFFPIAQTQEILRRARAGERFFTSHIFFGAKPDDALKKTSVIIGKSQMADLSKQPQQARDTGLLQESYYPVQIAYFDPDSTSGLPTYEISFHMQDNGVVPYYVIDYGDFRLQASLDEIEKEPSPICG